MIFSNIVYGIYDLVHIIYHVGLPFKLNVILWSLICILYYMVGVLKKTEELH